MKMVEAGKCHVCGTKVLLTKALYEAAQRSTSVSFYCCYGHQLCFTKITKEPEEPETDPAPEEVDDNVIALASYKAV